MSNNPVVDLIVRKSRRYGLDPRAALAVASVEGGLRLGAVGDGGHAFGPFQLNDAGGVITGRPGNHAAFANSRQGIDFALRGASRVARGKRGRAAVEAIVRGYERPADPNSEIARALGHYGGRIRHGRPASRGGAQRGAPTARTLGAPRTTSGSANSFADFLALLNSNNELIGAPSLPDFGPTSQPTRSPSVQLGPRARISHRRPILNPEQPPKPPKVRGRTLRFLEHFAAPYGLAITSTTGGKHAKGSYHYRGRAVDFGGDPSRMAALSQRALAHPQQFVEVIYTGPGNSGYSILNGRVVPNSQLSSHLFEQHTNHVHLAR